MNDDKDERPPRSAGSTAETSDDRPFMTGVGEDQEVFVYYCRDHWCSQHAYDDPDCNHGADGCIVERVKTPPRPDLRWVAGKGRRLHEPKTHYWGVLPAPPKVPVMVPSDIAGDVQAYAERRDAEKRIVRPIIIQWGPSEKHTWRERWGLKW